jgi:hypothetical protein
MKKTEEAAAKKKPKTSAAQIRVQKGGFYPVVILAIQKRIYFVFARLDRARPTIYHENQFPRSR